MQPKAHAALLASPGLGHLIPILELAKRLVTVPNFNVTVFVVTADNSISSSQLLQQLNSPNITVILLPLVDISGQIDQTTKILTQLAMMMREALPSFREAILSMKFRPTVIIVDLFGTEAFAIGDEFRMRKYVFITSTAWFLALTVHSPALDKVVEEGDLVKNDESMLIPGCMSIPAEDVPEMLLYRDDQIYGEYLRMGVEIFTADGILVNTWQDLEPATLRALGDRKKLGKPNRMLVHPIGPLVRPSNPGAGAGSEVRAWLDLQPSKSVIYVSLGSGGTLSAKQTTEMAWGLEMSEHRFIWVVRQPIENDVAAAIHKTGRDGGDETPEFLPDGFLTRTGRTGMVIPLWAPQMEILSHPSVGGFLSHSGWNSSLESMVNGVPMIAWPLYAEQGMNAAMLTEDIGVAIRSKILPSKEVVDRNEIATMVKALMEDAGKRARAQTLKESAEKAFSKGGSSYNSLCRVANECEVV